MRPFMILILSMAFVVGCTKKSEVAETTSDAAPAITLNVKAPDPIPVPEKKTPKSDTDWETIAHNKEIEVIETINLINPIAAFIAEGFKQYGNKLSPGLHEEWEDTQVQLGLATKVYDSCKQRIKAKQFDKKLFLDLEEVWQGLVKTGVAGIRAKTMLDAELKRMSR